MTWRLMKYRPEVSQNRDDGTQLFQSTAAKRTGFLSAWLKTEDSKHRKQPRTLKQIHADLCSLGFNGSYDRVAAFARLHANPGARFNAIQYLHV